MFEEPWDGISFTEIVKERETSWDLMETFLKVEC